jgi:hypothetical protein
VITADTAKARFRPARSTSLDIAVIAVFQIFPFHIVKTCAFMR